MSSRVVSFHLSSHQALEPIICTDTFVPGISGTRRYLILLRSYEYIPLFVPGIKSLMNGEFLHIRTWLCDISFRVSVDSVADRTHKLVFSGLSTLQFSLPPAILRTLIALIAYVEDFRDPPALIYFGAVLPFLNARYVRGTLRFPFP